jgi:hypothetical protein
MAELHAVIAETLADKKARLDGKEFRFLRLQLGISHTTPTSS